jgi:hypothetical protein
VGVVSSDCSTVKLVTRCGAIVLKDISPNSNIHFKNQNQLSEDVLQVDFAMYGMLCICKLYVICKYFL